MSDYERSKLFLLKSKIKRATPPTNSGLMRPPVRTPQEMRSPVVTGAPIESRISRGTPPDHRPIRQVVPVRPQVNGASASMNFSRSGNNPPQGNQFVSTPQYIQAPRSGPGPIFPRSAPQLMHKQQSGLPSETADAPEHLNQCGDCGRRFNDESFPKHRKVCKKVFLQKRKVFDAAKVRLQAIVEEANKSGGAPSGLLHQARSKQRSQPQPNPQLKAASGFSQSRQTPSSFAGHGGAIHLGAKNKTSWREKSAQFRAAIGSMRKENSGTNFYTNHPGAYQPKTAHDFSCQLCNRNFSSEESCKRHTAVCATVFNHGGRLQKRSGTLSHSTTRKVDSTSLRLGSTPSRVTVGRLSQASSVAPAIRRR